MTLIELMVALAILGLCAGLVFSNLGPWLGQGRAARDDARILGALQPTQLALAELAAAMIDPDSRTLTASDARFSVYLPRLAPTPTIADLRIQQDGSGARLILTSPALAAPSVLLDHAPPLRFETTSNDALTLEADRNGSWRPIASALFATNAPLACSFDPISRACR